MNVVELNEDFQDLLDALLESKVEFVVACARQRAATAQAKLRYSAALTAS